MKTPDEKYHGEAEYRLLVDSMVRMILDYRFTPGEMREAAVFACVMVENMKPAPPRVISRNEFSPGTPEWRIQELINRGGVPENK